MFIFLIAFILLQPVTSYSDSLLTSNSISSDLISEISTFENIFIQDSGVGISFDSNEIKILDFTNGTPELNNVDFFIANNAGTCILIEGMEHCCTHTYGATFPFYISLQPLDFYNFDEILALNDTTLFTKIEVNQPTNYAFEFLELNRNGLNFKTNLNHFIVVQTHQDNFVLIQFNEMDQCLLSISFSWYLQPNGSSSFKGLKDMVNLIHKSINTKNANLKIEGGSKSYNIKGKLKPKHEKTIEIQY